MRRRDRRSEPTVAPDRGAFRLLRLAAPAVLLAVAVRAQVPASPAGRLNVPPRLQVHRPFTLDVPLQGKPVNPYDPGEVAVDAEFEAPSGRTLYVPCYWSEEFDPLFGVRLNRDGWRLRFTAEEPGEHRVRILVRRGNGPTRVLLEDHFTVSPSDAPAFLTTPSPPSGFFAYRDGKPFIPIGLNLAWGDPENPARYLEQLDALARRGVNCVRLWIAPWWLPVERESGRYDPRASALLEAILERCERNGIRVILCIEQHSSFGPTDGGEDYWPTNPYNRARGGPCGRPLDFFTDAGARGLFLRKLRYLVARYGAYPSLLAWEIFNEVEHVPLPGGGLAANLPSILDWHREVAGYLRRKDPWRHLIATSSDLPLQERLLKEGLIDVVSLHVYAERDVPRAVADAVREAAQAFGAPVLAAEFGPRAEARAAESFPGGTWAALAAGGAGTGFYWWHRGQPQEDGWVVFSTARALVEALDWAADPPVPVRVEARLRGEAGAPPSARNVFLAPKVAFGGPTGEVQVAADGATTGAEGLPEFLLGSDQEGERTPCRIRVEAALDGVLRVRVRQVCGRTVLRVRVDGDVVAEEVLTSGPNNPTARESAWDEKWKVYVDTLDRDFAYDLPAGPRRVEIENAGRGWIRLGTVALLGCCRAERAPLAAWAVSGRRAGLAYLYAAPGAGDEWKRASIRMSSLADGRYRVEWRHEVSGTLLGEETATAREGALDLAPPPIRGGGMIALIARQPL